MRRIIVAGMLAIVVLYVGANVGYFYAMPVEVMARQTAGRAAVDHGGTLLGPLGATLIGAAILCSVFGALNGNILAKPRVAYALARDGLTFSVPGARPSALGHASRGHPDPRAAALLLVALLRDFDRLTTYFVVVEWCALLFAVGAVLVLRRHLPDAPRPFCTPGYPWVPLVFLARDAWSGLMAIVRGELDRAVPNYSPLVGLLIAAAGFPVYHVWRRLAAPASPGERREAEKEV